MDDDQGVDDIRHLVVAALVGATLSTGVCAGVIGGALTERAARTDPAGSGPVPTAVSAPARPGTPRADVVLPVAGLEQAKGVLATRAGVTSDEAFALLRGHARDQGIRLTALAHAVVAGAVDLSSPVSP